MLKCCNKNNIRKNADNAMAYFLPRDELKNELLIVFVVIYNLNKANLTMFTEKGQFSAYLE